RYELNDKYFDPNDPNPVVFLYIGGEGTALVKWVCWSNYTHMKWVQKHHALAIHLEHRFFGYSFPKWTNEGLADMSLEALSLLSPQQAVEDLANFIRTFQYNGKPLNNARWVAVGGSYPGAVCAWFRAKYPDLTVGAVCSSAPVWPKVDFYEFAEVIEATITDWDPHITPPLNPQNSSDFDLDVIHFLATLFQSFHEVIEYTFDGGTALTMSGYGVNSLCNTTNQQLNPGETNATRIRNIYFWTRSTEYGDNSNTTENSYTEMIGEVNNSFYNLNNGVDHADAAARGWIWLCCGVALGWLQTTDNGNSIFNRIIPLSYSIKLCNDVFGPEINTAYITNKTAQTAAYFNFPWNYTATNIVLPNGGYDPWHALGSYVNNTEMHQLSILIPKAGHCSNMYPEWKDEPTALTFQCSHTVNFTVLIGV
ncbi:hypothetical protein FO519_009510, partial [Halicephalobus sp. NKZ332]